ncbi:hypothetical protein PQD73_gp102 [Stenotrophomonas phage Salva]|uniref:Uncharacterized protein n=1 Tax=Stenotrophomonas phage Salva TaxID=2801524 RepID=A0A8B6Q882_9CAUD|nr:hypothetical protein PQD73_gp102 [Stenotrophomonas phage Salva]QQM18237.1 hypothetical protein CPT_Salva_074 [Stenotrophomonas phage Salva]
MARIAKTAAKKTTTKRTYVRKAKPVNEIIAEEVTKTMNAIGEEAKARRQIDQLNTDEISALKATVISQGLQIAAMQEHVNGTNIDTVVGAMEEAKLIHEWVEGSHRILIVDGKGVRTGKWAARNEIAVLEEYRAAGSFFDGIFPAGVFKATEVQFSGLGG